MGLFSRLFRGPEIDMEKSRANEKKMRVLFNQAVENGDSYRLIFGYTEDVSRFNYDAALDCQNKDWKSHCWMERIQPDNCGCSNSSRPL